MPPKNGQPSPQQGDQQGQGPAEAVQMIQNGFDMMGQIMAQSGQSLPPEDLQLFQAAQKATDNFIQSLTGPAQDQGQQPPGPSGPMAQNQSTKSQPMPPGSH